MLRTRRLGRLVKVFGQVDVDMRARQRYTLMIQSFWNFRILKGFKNGGL